MILSRIPYWLKGGLVGLIVFLVPLLYVVIFSVEDGSLIDWLAILMLMPFAFGSFWFGVTLNLIIGISEQALVYFISGVIIALLYRWIRKARNNSISHG